VPSKILLISLRAMEVKILEPTDHNGNENFIGHGKFWGSDITRRPASADRTARRCAKCRDDMTMFRNNVGAYLHNCTGDQRNPC